MPDIEGEKGACGLLLEMDPMLTMAWVSPGWRRCCADLRSVGQGPVGILV